MPLINCKIKLNLTWKKECVLSTDDGDAVFTINEPTRNGQRKYYLPRIDLEKYNVIIDGTNFYDNPTESDIKKYRKLTKVMTGEDNTTGSLFDFNYFNKHYKLVAVDLSKQKELDADPRAIQQIEFKYMLGTNSTFY